MAGTKRFNSTLHGILWDTGVALCTDLDGLATRGYGTKYVTIFEPQQIESRTVAVMFGHLGRVGKRCPRCRFHEPNFDVHRVTLEAPRTQVRNLEGMRQKSPDEGSGLCQIESTFGLSLLNVFLGAGFMEEPDS